MQRRQIEEETCFSPICLCEQPCSREKGGIESVEEAFVCESGIKGHGLVDFTLFCVVGVREAAEQIVYLAEVVPD